MNQYFIKNKLLFFMLFFLSHGCARTVHEKPDLVISDDKNLYSIHDSKENNKNEDKPASVLVSPSAAPPILNKKTVDSDSRLYKRTDSDGIIHYGREKCPDCQLIDRAKKPRLDLYKCPDSNGLVYYTDDPKKYPDCQLIIRGISCKAITKSQMAEVEKAIKNKLTDPYSAHFKWSKNTCFKSVANEDITYCAFVNSKNQFGGYVGYTAYSRAKLPPNPDESCHSFHFKAATDSGEVCHPLEV